TLPNRMRADFDGSRKQLMGEYFKNGVQGFSEERLAAAPDDYAKLWAMVPANPPKAGAFLTDLLFNHLVTDWRPIFPRIEVPCLLVSGDVSHAITPEAAQWIAETVPDCAWVRFSEEELGDHHMFQRSYKKFNTAVRNFLNGVEVLPESDEESETVIPASATSNIAAVRSKVPAPDSAEPEPEEEAPEVEASERLFDIQKVTINPRTLIARVRVGEGHPLLTSEDPEATDRVLELLPDLANHICVGDVAPSFGDVIGDTEVAHLLEHTAVEIMARTELGGDISTGRTRSLSEDPRLFEIELDCPDDVLTAGALSSAAWILDWAFSGAEDSMPDVEGIVDGLRGMIFDLTGGEPEESGYDGDLDYEDDRSYEYGEEAEIIDFAGVTGSLGRLPEQLGATGVVSRDDADPDSGNSAQEGMPDPDATIVSTPVDDED
ncbi:MAG: hypothetical protein IJH87_06175, partial [Atopobiaceae bacterium]|nr:hypothetical protein [Atopobiaceae bacterium]